MVTGVWYDCGKKFYLQYLAKENLQSALASYARAKNEYVALEQHIATARKAAKTFTEEKKLDDAKCSIIKRSIFSMLFREWPGSPN